MNPDSLALFLSPDSASLEARLKQLLPGLELAPLAGFVQQFAQVPGVLGDISKAVWNLLDIRMSDVLVKTWNETGILKKYLSPEEYKPEEEVLVELSEHEIRSEHHPRLEITVDGRKEFEMVIDVELELDVKGMVLLIQDAKIKELRTGWCEAKAAVSCKGLQLLERDTGKLNLPGSIAFGDGIPIAF